MKDKNKIKIIEGQEVHVPEPIKELGDLHNNEFMGTVKGFHGQYVTVSDCHDNCFDIEPERLTIEKSSLLK